jgi:hypothetical protein
MNYMSGSKAARNSDSLGFKSLGGSKKAGTWGGNVFMRVPNVGNAYTYRVPQRQPTLAFSLLNTTKRPVQFNRNGYAVSHSGMLG